MDLKQGQITIGQLAQNPKALALLNQFDPRLIHHPMAILVQGWTVNQAVAFARQKGAPEQQIQAVIAQLEAL